MNQWRLSKTIVLATLALGLLSTNSYQEDQVNPHAFLGIIFQKISAEKAEILGFDNPYGSYVSKVIPNSAADKAGIEPFDYIFGFDEYRVSEQKDLSAILDLYEPLDRATIHFVRKGKPLQLPIVFFGITNYRFPPSTPCTDPFLGVTKDLSSPVWAGVRVNILENSTAEALGMASGDIIYKINDYQMVDWNDITIAIDNIKVGTPVKVDFYRDNQPFYGSAPMKSECATKIGPQFAPSFPIEVDPVNGQILTQQLLSPEEILFSNQKFGIQLRPQQNLEIPPPQLALKDGKLQLKLQIHSPGETVIQMYNDRGRLFYDYQMGQFSGIFEEEMKLNPNVAQRLLLFIRHENQSNTYLLEIN